MKVFLDVVLLCCVLCSHVALGYRITIASRCSAIDGSMNTCSDGMARFDEYRHSKPCYREMCIPMRMCISKGDDTDSENAKKYGKPLIIPEEPPLNLIKSLKSRLENSRSQNDNEKRLDFNWRMGSCKNVELFESTDVIRRFKFIGDYLAFGLIDGRVCVIKISNGDILDRYCDHKNEITSLDFDGMDLCSGSSNGETVLYKLTYGNKAITSNNAAASSVPNGLNYKWKFKHHSRSVTGLKIVRLVKKDRSIKSRMVETPLMVSCGMDKALFATNIDTGEVVYHLSLPMAPLCMDIFGGYVAVGLFDGRLLILKAETGQILLQFQAHADRVRSVYFFSDTVLFTGSNKGVVKRWDLAGNEAPKKASSREEASKDKPKSKSRGSSEATAGRANNGTSVAPSRFIDYYFIEQTEQVRLLERNSFVSSTSSVRKSTAVREETKPAGVIERILAKVKSLSPNLLKGDRNESGSSGVAVEGIDNLQLSSCGGDSEALLTDDNRMKFFMRDFQRGKKAVISLQGDDSKLVAAYEDGVVVCWDTKTKEVNFELSGRTSLISTIQYDLTKLIADGTSTLLVAHDFEDPPDEPEDFAYRVSS